MATVGAKAFRRPPPGHPAPGRGINIDSAPGGGSGSTGSTRRVASEGHALGEAFVIAHAAQPGPSEPVGPPAWLRNPARRARGSGFAPFPYWSSDANPRLGRESRCQRPRPCAVRLDRPSDPAQVLSKTGVHPALAMDRRSFGDRSAEMRVYLGLPRTDLVASYSPGEVPKPTCAGAVASGAFRPLEAPPARGAVPCGVRPAASAGFTLSALSELM
ncbi:unnamed protein product [Rangifer tarandus platyrhynchus]|uniref:Uncharacterized protein n=2 Tax=Rangifer tarandus platyrhynchus TaxID=3082113 RepID=A0ACB0E0A7_RANTA|nr:unnamed protein product [Rangifer tarandus platyrhynchus]CAI9693756.1 unnamed protein product [Rangifer tarandus platyrhynchus]